MADWLWRLAQTIQGKKELPWPLMWLPLGAIAFLLLMVVSGLLASTYFPQTIGVGASTQLVGSDRLFILLTSPFAAYFESTAVPIATNLAWSFLTIAIAEMYFKITRRHIDFLASLAGGIAATYILGLIIYWIGGVSGGTSIVTFTVLVFMLITVAIDLREFPGWLSDETKAGSVPTGELVLFIAAVPIAIQILLWGIPWLVGFIANPAVVGHLAGGFIGLFLAYTYLYNEYEKNRPQIPGEVGQRLEKSYPRYATINEWINARRRPIAEELWEDTTPPCLNELLAGIEMSFDPVALPAPQKAPEALLFYYKLTVIPFIIYEIISLQNSMLFSGANWSHVTFGLILSVLVNVNPFVVGLWIIVPVLLFALGWLYNKFCMDEIDLKDNINTAVSATVYSYVPYALLNWFLVLAISPIASLFGSHLFTTHIIVVLEAIGLLVCFRAAIVIAKTKQRSKNPRLPLVLMLFIIIIIFLTGFPYLTFGNI